MTGTRGVLTAYSCTPPRLEGFLKSYPCPVIGLDSGHKPNGTLLSGTTSRRAQTVSQKCALLNILHLRIWYPCFLELESGIRSTRDYPVT